MAGPDRVAESRKASVRAKVEHPFLIVKWDFGFTKTRYRGMAKNLNPGRAVRFSELGDAGPCRRPDGVTASASLPETPQNHTKAPPRRPKQPLLSSSRVPGGKLGRKPHDDQWFSSSAGCAALSDGTCDSGVAERRWGLKWLSSFLNQH